MVHLLAFVPVLAVLALVYVAMARIERMRPPKRAPQLSSTRRSRGNRAGTTR